MSKTKTDYTGTVHKEIAGFGRAPVGAGKPGTNASASSARGRHWN